MKSVKLTKEQIDKITYGITTLDHTQRELVRHELKQMILKTGGTLYEESAHKELLRMQNAGEISEIDRNNLEDALFG